ncbi:MAG TPA: GreA/GreB family elongation factor, partial [Tepidiformaceae bacterium]|nr:GreA/GreB family elongation factor [Tepidiformaceae bacterium]
TVRVTRLDKDETVEFKLVGAREANARERKISVESPVGKELLGRRPGDEVRVSVPSGVIQYRVDAVTHS